MGWYGECSGKSRKKHMDRVFTWKGNGGHCCRVVKSAMHGWAEYYAAVEHYRKRDDGTEESLGVSAVIALVYRENKSGMIWYKDMGEDCGPFYYNCPMSILGVLTPTDNKRALAWRDECWKEHVKKGHKLPKGRKTEQKTGATK